MIFKKEFLLDTIDSEDQVKEKIVGKSRWSTHYEMIFKFEGKFYASQYSVGSTEQQEESPYEYAPDEIECDEVVPVEKIVIEYVKVPK